MRYTETIEIGDGRGGVQEEEMVAELTTPAYARIQALDVTLGDARSFLSFQERVDWAESAEGSDAIIDVANKRA